jgi:hypothetical protein
MNHVPGTFWSQASVLITSLYSPLPEPRGTTILKLLLPPSQLAILSPFPTIHRSMYHHSM